MLKRVKNSLFFFALVILSNCVERYQLPKSVDTQRYLVINSFLDPVQATCSVNLQWSQHLSETSAPLTESGAIVTLEDDKSNLYPIQGLGNGSYFSSSLAIDYSRKYRINISTSKDVKYQSDWVEPLITPAIDSVTWDSYYQQLRIKVSTHDPLNKTRFYQWSYDETWEYASAFNSFFEYQNGVLVRRQEDIHTCWKTESASEIFCASSAALDRDQISDFAINLIKDTSAKLYIRYSINVKQTALSPEAYNYLTSLKKNSQGLGTPYDPLPSQVTGNYSSLNSSAVALGFFMSGSVQQKRIFVANDRLPPELKHLPDYGSCQEFIVPNDQLGFYKNSKKYLPVVQYFVGDDLQGYYFSTMECIDCRLAGGKNVKPSFW